VSPGSALKKQPGVSLLLLEPIQVRVLIMRWLSCVAPIGRRFTVTCGGTGMTPKMLRTSLNLFSSTC